MSLYGILGLVEFEVVTSPEKFDARRRYSFARHEVVEGRPQRQLLERQDAVVTLARSGDRGFAGLLPSSEQIHVDTFSFLIRTERVYKRAIVSYHHPIRKRLITYTVEADPADLDPSQAGSPDPARRLPPDAAAFLTFSGNAATGDTLKISERCESEADARAKAEAALHSNNMRRQTCKMTLVGEPSIASGLVAAVQGFDQCDGNYLLESSTHTLERNSGYETVLAGRRV